MFKFFTQKKMAVMVMDRLIYNTFIVVDSGSDRCKN